MQGEEVARRPWEANRAGEDAPTYSAASLRSKSLGSDLRFRRLVGHLHSLGPRPLGEFLLEVAGDDPRLIEGLERFGTLDPDTVQALGARTWYQPAAEAGRVKGLDTAAIDELAALGQRFVGWRWEDRNGKATKPPIAASGGYADTTNPATWTDLGEAQEAARRDRLDGVGFVLDAARDGIVGIDLDGCRDPDSGAIAPWAARIIGNTRSYAEISPSGTGVKILCRADPLPKLLANKRTIGKANGAKAPAVEVYTNGRYFCLTGQIVDGSPDEIVDATKSLERLAAWIAKAAKPGGELPPAFLALLGRDARLRDAWEKGTKLGKGADASASALDWSLALYLRPNLDDGDIAAVLRAHPHGQIGGGKLKGQAAERRIEKILAELPSKPSPDNRPDPSEWRTRLDLRCAANLEGKAVKAREWVVDQWIPRGT